MVMKWTAVCLMALAMLSSYCDAQWHEIYKPTAPRYQKPAQIPVQPLPPPPPVKQVPQEPQQTKQTFETPLTWTFPEDPKPVLQPEVPFELRFPIAAVSVAVECMETHARVEVKRDMFGRGQGINPAALTLGNCGAVGEDSVAQVLVYETALQDCGSTLMMTEDALIYSFTLNYSPQPLVSLPVVRKSSAAVIVECHYPRKHNVSSLPLDPVWVPYAAARVAEEFLYFTLKLMTADWQFERPVYQYFLGEMIYVEATVKQYFHVPLRVYVSSCVATLAPDMNANPRYAFIENYGCMIDARLTGSASTFIPRTEENKLQFQIEAFRFQGADSGVIFITCHLKASSTSFPLDAQHRACSYGIGWTEASGGDAVCGSCESPGMGSAPIALAQSLPDLSGSVGAGATAGTWGVGGGGGSAGSAGSAGGAGFGMSGSGTHSTGGRKIRDVQLQTEFFEWEGDVTLGPIPIGERVVT